jgi:hypothetical protein
MPPTGIPVGRPGTLERPLTLEPGGYRLWLQGQDRPGREFVVDPGRWLLLKVVPGAGRSDLDVVRGLYASELFPLRPSRRDSRSGWTLSALQNRAENLGRLQMVLTLEKTYDPGEAILQSIYPRDVWIDVAPESGDRPRVAVRLLALPGYPAPAWSVDAVNWPADADSKRSAAPVLEAWWDPDRTAPPEVSLEYGRHFHGFEELRGQTVDLADGKVTVESVSVETRTVMIDPERSGQRTCLVVRVAYPPEHPVRVRLDALGITGFEERFYQDAGKSMTMFWPIAPDQPLAAIRRLDLVSLDSFKREAQERGFHIRLDGLGPPVAGDARPPSTQSGRVQANSMTHGLPAAEPLPSSSDGR